MFSNVLRTMLVLATLLGLSESVGSCPWLKIDDRAYNSMFQVSSNNTIVLLQKMGNHSESRPAEFPERPYTHVMQLSAEEKILFLSESLTRVENVFSSGSHNATSWHPKDIDIFMSDLFRQTTELKHCVKVMKLSPSASVLRASKKMKLHFRMLENTLKEKVYDAKAWEDVRVLLLAHLLRLNVLAASIKSIDQ